jgi:itaconate CoA-transferase
MLEALGEWMSQPYFYAEYGGAQQPRSGAEHATIAPYGPFATADGTVFFGIQNEREWAAFCMTVLGDSAIALEPEFVSNALRVANRPALHALIGGVVTLLTTTQARERLEAAGIANAELRDMEGFSEHPQLAARSRWRDVDSPVGPLRTLIPPVTSRSVDFRMGPIPALGQHTDSVLAELAETD